MLFPACFAKVSTSYWGAVASWLAVYGWTLALPCWVPMWTGCPAGDVPLDLVWAAAADGRLRCTVRPGMDTRALTTAELRVCMLWAGRQRSCFISSMVLTLRAVMQGEACRLWEFPQSERWALGLEPPG